MKKIITFKDYEKYAKKTDFTNDNGRYLGIIGFAGEVGDLASVLKKKPRDEVNQHHLNHIQEEIGDCLWYCFKIARSMNFDLASLVSLNGDNSLSEIDAGSLKKINENELITNLISIAGRLANGENKYSKITSRKEPNEKIQSAEIVFKKELKNALFHLTIISQKFETTLIKAASANIEKTYHRYICSKNSLKSYDKSYPSHEQFSPKLKVVFKEVGFGDGKKSLMYINKIKFGSPLSDNSKIHDDYRFHDAFHLAYLAVLGWSPVMRSLLQLKRKSCHQTDMVDDGARAKIIEEGISYIVFKYAEENNLLKNVERIDTHILKLIKTMVAGLEVDDRPLPLWEESIKEGFKIFRALKKHRTGKLIIDMESRSIKFKKIKKQHN